MKKFAIVAAVASIMGYCVPTQAAPVVWGNVYTDMLVNENAAQKESQIIGIEGGVMTGNGTDVYGFFEHNPNLENEFGKVTIHSSLVGDFGVYGRASMFKEGDFSEDRYILGAGYQGFVGSDWAIKPYVGALRIDQGEDSSENQIAFGYAGFKVLNPGVVLSSWVDARVDDSKVKASGSIGIQKDLAIVEGAYVGAFYNMNYDEQGIKGFSDSVQLRVGYHF
ncbi:MAG: hypothetical protein ACRC0G_08805 [Fusobacteriaceae bacterium]